MISMDWPITVWPGAVCYDWFGVFAFYTSCLAIIALAIFTIAAVIYLVKNWNNPDAF